jgi:predicted lipase
LAEAVRRNPNLPWWFTGHSLGAALATLAARRFGRALALYTYGSPKVGDAAFVAQVARSVVTHYRFVNHRDIATRFPHLAPFEHAGIEANRRTRGFDPATCPAVAARS